MTIKQAAMWLCQPGIVSMIHDPTTKKALSVAVKALAESELGANLAEVGTNCSEFPNNSDAISRQAAIDAIERNACNTQRIFEAITALPSAQPDRRCVNSSQTPKRYSPKP